MEGQTKTPSADFLRFWRRLGKEPALNLALRATVAQAPPGEQGDWWSLFSHGWVGFLCWLNLCGWVYEPRSDGRHLPLITWRVQDQAGRRLWRAIDEGHDLLIDKSRDMGASWLCLYVLLWYWLFVPETPLLVASRKQEYVDRPGDPDCLFWKLCYAIEHLPPWLRPQVRPRVDRTHMHLRNPRNGSVIDGESTNGDLGRGGRRKAILLDEFAAVDSGAEILSSTADTTPCRLFNSTPKGRGNAFADMRFSGKVRVITLHWKDHPDKGRDACQEPGPDGGLRWTSPWYRTQCARRVSRKEIAQELDIDYLASGEMFFDSTVLGQIRVSGQLRPPDATGELHYRVETHEAGQAYRLGEIQWAPGAGKGRLGLWCPLESGPQGRPRPTARHSYVAFADISNGQGASNSVISVADVDADEQVAQFVCPYIPPHELACYAVAICKWFGGATGWALLGWEANGPGGIFGREVVRLGHPYLLRMRDEDVAHRPAGRKLGWHSTRRAKELLLSEYRRALARGELVIHSADSIREAEQYVYYAGGGIGPSSLVQEAQGARAAHGDRVIADAGLVLCMHEQIKTPPPEPPPERGSYLSRRQEFLRQERKGNQW